METITLKISQNNNHKNLQIARNLLVEICAISLLNIPACEESSTNKQNNFFILCYYTSKYIICFSLVSLKRPKRNSVRFSTKTEASRIQN